MDDASSDLLRRLSRATRSMPYALIVNETRDSPIWLMDDEEEEGQRRLGLLAPAAPGARRRRAGRARHRRGAAAPARGRGGRAPVRGKPALPRRAAQRRALGRDGRGAARFGRGGRDRRHRPALALRPDRAAVRVRARRRVRRIPAGRGTPRRGGAPTPACGRASRASSTATRTAGCASATRSSTTPPTRAFPSAGAASCTRASPRRSRRRRPRSTTRRRRSRCTIRRRGATTGRGTTRGSAASAHVPWPRTSRRRDSTSSPSLPGAVCARSAAATGPRCSSPWAPCARRPASSTSRSTRFAGRRSCSLTIPSSRRAIYARRTRARVRDGRLRHCSARDSARAYASSTGRDEPAAVAARAMLRALRSEIRVAAGARA